MNYSQFQTVLQRTSPAKIYLFTGPENFYHRQGRQAILDRYLPPEGRNFNYARFGDSDGDLLRGLSLAMTAPLGSAHRVVVFHGPGLIKAEAIQRIERYCAAASSRNILILETEKLEKGNRFERLIQENGVLIECPLLNPAEQKKWIQEYAKSNGFIMDLPAVSLTADRAGSCLSEMALRMDKLFDWIGNEKRISSKEVEIVLPPDPDVPLWELSNALSEGKAAKAFSAVRTLLQEGIVLEVLLAVVTNQIRKWVAAKEMLRESKPAEVIGKDLKIPPFKLSSFLQLVRRLPSVGLHGLISAAVDADDQMKSSPVPKRIHLEKLVFQVTALVRSSTGVSR